MYTRTTGGAVTSWLEARLRCKRSGFEPRPGTFCCVLFPHPGVKMGTGEHTAWGNPAMD